MLRTATELGASTMVHMRAPCGLGARYIQHLIVVKPEQAFHACELACKLVHNGLEGKFQRLVQTP